MNKESTKKNTETFTIVELQLANYVLQTTVDDEPKKMAFDIDKQDTALSIMKKLKTCITKDDKGTDIFNESEISFSTEEKTLLLEQSKRKWGIHDIETYQSLKSKLA